MKAKLKNWKTSEKTSKKTNSSTLKHTISKQAKEHFKNYLSYTNNRIRKTQKQGDKSKIDIFLKSISETKTKLENSEVK